MTTLLSRNPSRSRVGDIVTCTSPENPREHVCKRLVALEGAPVAVPMWPPHRFLGEQRYEMLEVRSEHCWSMDGGGRRRKEVMRASEGHMENEKWNV